MFDTVAAQMKVITRGIVNLVSEQELAAKLERSRLSGNPLVIKYGADPSAADIHLGHTVPLLKLREFQDLGHQVVFLIGDFTARIGDPSGRSETRKALPKAVVMENARTYQQQVFKVLDQARTRVVYNGDWLEKMGAEEFIGLAARYTVARMLERDDFAKRYAAGRPISVMEFLYPLIQAYDSVELRSDVEIGGTDQTFNLLVGRDIQREMGQEPQVVLTLPLLEGLDGKEKMSKSLGNYVGVSEDADTMLGKIMSISDTAMMKYIRLLTDWDAEKIENEIKTLTRHPRELKMALSQMLVERFHGADKAKHASAVFEQKFGKKKEAFDFSAAAQVALDPTRIRDGRVSVCYLAVAAGVKSASQARRLIEQRAVRVDGKLIENPDETLELRERYDVQAGKLVFARVTVKK